MKKSLKLALLFLTLTLFACGGGSSGGGNTTDGGNGGGGTPNPDPAPTTTALTIVDAQAGEGGNITFTVTANPPIAKQVTFTFEATVDNKATNPASISDLSGQLTGNSTIATNDSSTTISIAIADDLLRENNETFLVMLSDLSPSDATFTDHTAIGTILANDDATGIVIISVADAEATEDSGTIKFKVTSEFPAATGSQFTVDYEAIFGSGLNYASSDDFGATSGTATIPAGSDSTTISISLRQDTTIEPDETFSLRLTNPSSNATLDLANTSAVGTILNDDLGEISDATAIIGDKKITLNWTNPDSNIFAGVTISQTTLQTDCSGGRELGDITSDTIRDLTNGQAYSFRICARSISGSLSSGEELENLIPDRHSDSDNIPDRLDVDDDNDGLIEISDATGLYNIRHSLTGSYITSNGVTSDTGCPDSGCNGYELVADIDLSNSKYSNGWTPIGSNDDGNRFTAILDGNNNRISGLRISTTDSNIGLFSAMQNATISNLKLTDVSIDGGHYVGALVGQATGTNTLSNIELIGDESQSSSDAEIKGTGERIGGLVGDFTGAITDASSSLTVRGSGSTGGLVGWLEVNGLIKNSNSSGSVSVFGGNNIGGLVGYINNGAAISNSWASGNVLASSDGVGGLVGLANGETISNSWASGNVSGNDGVGGLVGLNSSGIRNSWANGNVSGNDTIGGLVGLNSNRIGNSWASGNVSGNDIIGGLIGRNIGTIRNNWASGVVSSSEPMNIGGLVGSNNFPGMVGVINGRNYKLYNATGTSVTNSFHLASTADLETLSGATGDTTTDSDWHTGFDSNDPGNQIDLDTRFCDTNGNGMIDGTPDGQGERTANNTVWVMPSDLTSSSEFPAGMRNSDNVPAPTTDTAGNPVNPDTYYAIPALRCIANTADATNDAEIYRLRKREIDRQRRNFPQP